jgi:hypothetical protein
VPVINRQLADGKTSAREMCEKVAREQELMAQVKVYKALRDELDPEGDLKATPWTPEQKAVLDRNGVTTNGFSPTMEKGVATDKYVAKEFEVKVKGFSSLPKLSEVRAKLSSKKPLNGPGQLMAAALRGWAGVEPTLASLEAKLSWLDGAIYGVKKQLVPVRQDVQATKFAIILGRRWFDEFTSREENTITLTDPFPGVKGLGDVEFAISVRSVEVPV